jgi:uncharacterized protein YlbG (UPF0298 family)
MAAAVLAGAAAAADVIRQVCFQRGLWLNGIPEECLMFAERIGYIVWFNDWKAARGLDKYGTLHYLSRKMHYAVLYVNAENAEEAVVNLERLSYVRKIERSYRGEIREKCAG